MEKKIETGSEEVGGLNLMKEGWKIGEGKVLQRRQRWTQSKG